MFKSKTHKATKKRIRLTGSGKGMFRKNNQSHFNIRRSSKRRSRHRKDNTLSSVNKRMLRLLGI